MLIIMLAATALTPEQNAMTSDNWVDSSPEADTVEMPADAAMETVDPAEATAEAYAEPITDAQAAALEAAADETLPDTMEQDSVDRLGRISIACDGNWYEGDPFGENEKIRHDRRRYIVDPVKHMVSYWNEYREIALPTCDRSYVSCEVEFEPTQIQIKATLNSVGSSLLIMDRRHGSIDYVSFTKGGKTRFFRGQCERTVFPVAHTDRNIF